MFQHIFINLSDGNLKTVVVVLIVVDAIFSFGAAIISIIANAYCSGTTGLSSIGGFNYCKFIFVLNNFIHLLPLIK